VHGEGGERRDRQIRAQYCEDRIAQRLDAAEFRAPQIGRHLAQRVAAAQSLEILDERISRQRERHQRGVLVAEN
jgi:hypothetical protein